MSVWKWEKCNLWDTVSEGVWVSEECALKKKRECASDCEMVCIKGRECVWVWVRVMWKILYSQVASRHLRGTAFTQNSHYISFWQEEPANSRCLRSTTHRAHAQYRAPTKSAEWKVLVTDVIYDFSTTVWTVSYLLLLCAVRLSKWWSLIQQ